MSALKHTHEKVGDHWEPKPGGKGPERRAGQGGKGTNRKTAGGVDATAEQVAPDGPRQEAGRLGPLEDEEGELVDALQKANNRKTAKARS